jgi:hypothetical protein
MDPPSQLGLPAPAVPSAINPASRWACIISPMRRAAGFLEVLDVQPFQLQGASVGVESMSENALAIAVVDANATAYHQASAALCRHASIGSD